nr:type II toxin-antitoxin system RelE/ParE family toxin [Niabella beijingensis]
MYFSEAIRSIRRDSVQNATKVKREILQKISELSVRPEIHAPDKYKNNNMGNYRAFELRHYRIAYLIMEDVIIIARIRHTSQNPREY